MKILLAGLEIVIICLITPVVIAISYAVVASSEERKDFMETCSLEHKPYECALAWKTGKLPK